MRYLRTAFAFRPPPQTSRVNTRSGESVRAPVLGTGIVMRSQMRGIIAPIMQSGARGVSWFNSRLENLGVPICFPSCSSRLPLARPAGCAGAVVSGAGIGLRQTQELRTGIRWDQTVASLAPSDPGLQFRARLPGFSPKRATAFGSSCLLSYSLSGTPYRHFGNPYRP